MSNLIVSKLDTSSLVLRSGKALNISDCVAEVSGVGKDGTPTGAVRVVPKSAKAVRSMFGLTASEAKFVVRQACNRIKSASAAVFSAMASEADVTGLGMRQTAGGSLWFGLKRVEDVKDGGKVKADAKAAKDMADAAAKAKAAEEKSAKLMDLLAKLGGLDKAAIEAALGAA
jgi:hypothetical protein